MFDISTHILSVPKNIHEHINLKALDSHEHSVETLFRADFFSWLEEMMYQEEWSVKSWKIGGERFLWDPESALTDALSEGEIKEYFDPQPLSKLTDTEILQFVYQLRDESIDDMSQALHVIPLSINNKKAVLLGALEFWQGGIVADWTGVAYDDSETQNMIINSGFMTRDNFFDKQILSIWQKIAN